MGNAIAALKALRHPKDSYPKHTQCTERAVSARGSIEIPLHDGGCADLQGSFDCAQDDRIAILDDGLGITRWFAILDDEVDDYCLLESSLASFTFAASSFCWTLAKASLSCSAGTFLFPSWTAGRSPDASRQRPCRHNQSRGYRQTESPARSAAKAGRATADGTGRTAQTAGAGRDRRGTGIRCNRTLV